MSGSKPPHHPITSAASMRRLFSLLLTHPGFRRAFLRLLKTIFSTYLRPQYFQGRAHAKVPLEMDLDACVPFDLTWLACYVGFVRLWQGSLGWLHRTFGDRALPEMEAFLAGMESLFLAAREVFAVTDSTVSSRPGPWPPGCRPSLDWLMIQQADRNSFCFPSLHVMIARYTAIRIGAAIDLLQAQDGAGPVERKASGEAGEDDSFRAEKGFLEERAARITESIVYVKQHSLSDIPAGLFLLRNMQVTGDCPASTLEDDMRFMRLLFPGGDGRITPFMIALYQRLERALQADRMGASAFAGPAPGLPQRVLLDFLKDYRQETSALMLQAFHPGIPTERPS
ncbi:MAG: hypothetical protein ABI036_01655 [Fibrobacteria bacterium]